MSSARGTIKRLVLDKGFGFLLASDGSGTEYFFHSSACGFPFDSARQGDAVTFTPSSGPKGPRAEGVERACV
jgi:CspA family cold shock protein